MGGLDDKDQAAQESAPTLAQTTLEEQDVRVLALIRREQGPLATKDMGPCKQSQ